MTSTTAAIPNKDVMNMENETPAPNNSMSQPSDVLDRACKQCRQPISNTRRRDSKFCKDACRRLFWRQRKKALATLDANKEGHEAQS